jgi:hypothetical protein
MLQSGMLTCARGETFAEMVGRLLGTAAGYPCQGRNKPASQKDANRELCPAAQSSERTNAHLKY